MKLNKILMALAATAIVGCTSEDVNDFNAKQAPEDSRLIELNSDFVLAGIGVDGEFTRTHWAKDATTGAIVNEFLPIYGPTPAADQALDVAVGDAKLQQAVGLCWLGQTPGAEVYTNYQFYHFGWLNKGEAVAEVDKCGELYNGCLYSDITPLAAVTNGAGGEALPGTDWTVAKGLPAKSIKAGADNLNYNSGVYKTDNKSIFGGTYIVYYPYDRTFQDVGTIPAKAETTFNPAAIKLDDPVVGKNTFRYSAPVTIKGGDQAADFALYNLSTLVQLRVGTPDGDPMIGVKQFDQIVLVSKSGKLLKQVNLAADKIVAGQKGEALYTADKESTPTITATLPGARYFRPASATTAPKPTSAYITVLPTTVDDLEVLVHNTDGTWARKEMPNTTFEAGKAKRLDIIVSKDDFKAELFAVDEASLTGALTKARAMVTADPAAKPTIEVIGDITLATSPYDIAQAATDPNITITGDDIIVPENHTLNVNANMESKIRVLGKGCCTNPTWTGGRLVVQGGTISDVTMEPTDAKITGTAPATYDLYNPEVQFKTAAATVAAGSTFTVQAGNVNVDNAVEFKGDIVIAKDAKLTVNGTGDLNFRGTTDDTIDNYGTIEVKKGGKFDITAVSGPTTSAVGQRMTNEEGAKFIHNVDAGVGTSVQNMHQNGEYRCRVNMQDKLNDAFLQWTACSVIEMVNTSALSYNLATAKNIPTKDDGTTAWKHKGKYIDIEVNSGTAVTTFDNLVNDNKGDTENIQIGNLTVTAGGLNVNFTGTADPKNSRTLTVNGNMLVKVATNLTASQKIDIKKVDGTGGNLTVEKVTLTYAGTKANKDGLAVAGDITVIGDGSGTKGFFNASALNAIKISCANFYLTDKAKAQFGNRTGSTDKTMSVTGTISNPKDCMFYIDAATDPNLLAWITCSSLIDGGLWDGARPIVE